MGTQILHVNGPTPIYIATEQGPSPGTMLFLGTSVDGVTITLEFMYKEIYVDQWGPSMPFDMQYFLQSATIEFDLEWYDDSILTTCQIPGDSAAWGTAGSAGQLMIQNQLYRRLLVKSTPSNTGLTSVEACWNFPQAIVVESNEAKLGTINSIWKMKWKAYYAQASTSFGALLFNTVCT